MVSLVSGGKRPVADRPTGHLLECGWAAEPLVSCVVTVVTGSWSPREWLQGGNAW